MISVRHSQITRTITLVITIFSLSLPAYAKYSGGTGEPNDPYQIATAEDLMLLGESAGDYDKHFILTDDIDLDPNLPGRKIFDRAVIGSDFYPFRGVFDGNGHTISHLTVRGEGYLGLFGQLQSGAMVSDLGLVAVDVNGAGDYIGGLVGSNYGDIINSCSTGIVSGWDFVGILAGSNLGHVVSSYSTGTVSGSYYVGGLVGCNYWGSVTSSYSTGTVSGFIYVGGLVGYNGGSVANGYGTGMVSGGGNVGGLVGSNEGTVIISYSTGAVSGNHDVGGLVGDNEEGTVTSSYGIGTVSGDAGVGGLVGYNNGGSVTASYSTGTVSGNDDVGGLVGYNEDGSVTSSYSTGIISGNEDVGGLVGYNYYGRVTNSFWDVQTSGQDESDGGIGLTTAQMQDINGYLLGGWDFVGEVGNGLHETWQMPTEGGYPVLSVFAGYQPPALQGYGTPASPYLIGTAQELGAMVYYAPDVEYRLCSDLDLSGVQWLVAVIPGFQGRFDGAGHVIHGLTIRGLGYLGLFGRLESGAVVENLGVVDANVVGTEDHIGILAGSNIGDVVSSYSTGMVSGHCSVGGLVGYNEGSVTSSYSIGTVWGTEDVGGLVGCNDEGDVSSSYSTGAVSGTSHYVGGLVGANEHGSVVSSYSTGTVSGGGYYVGGLVGWDNGSVIASFWDVQTSGQPLSANGLGLTTDEMKQPTMYGLNGWANDPNWVMDAGADYPRLVWQGTGSPPIPQPVFDWLVGEGTAEAPYEVTSAEQLILIGRARVLWDKSFVLSSDIDLRGSVQPSALIGEFSGRFDGRGHTISHLIIHGNEDLGLFGKLEQGAVVENLGVVDANVVGKGDHIGILAGSNFGDVVSSYSTGKVSGSEHVGGLVGYNSGGTVDSSYSTGTVSGFIYVGGLVGDNRGSVASSYCTGTVSGSGNVGGLVGSNGGSVTSSYSTGTVSGSYDDVGGLVGINRGSVTSSYSTGIVSGYVHVGGLVGDNYGGYVSTSYSMAAVSGNDEVGGLVGDNEGGTVTNSYSTGTVLGNHDVGGLVGFNGGRVASSYSNGTVGGNRYVGGLVGRNPWGRVTASFWDAQTSGQAESDGGIGLTTAQMQDINSYLLGGWDFVGEVGNGLHETWQMPTEGGYPVLSVFAAYQPPALQGEGTPASPYLIDTAQELGAIMHYASNAEYRLSSDLDLSGVLWSVAVVPGFEGHFDGGGHVIRGLTIGGGDDVGLFARLGSGAVVENLGVVDANVVGTEDHIGILAGSNFGHVVSSYSTGTVSGYDYVGGLVGSNGGSVTNSYSTGMISGYDYVGGLVGYSRSGRVTASFWDAQTSGQARSAGGEGLTTAEMQTAGTFLEAGWDFIGETTNGTDNIWWIDEGQDYPRLWWEDE